VGTILDTSVLIDIERGARALASAEDVAIAAITASELLQGVLRADDQHRLQRESFVEGILATVPTIPFSLRIARVHAELWAQQIAAGRKLEAHDLLVASTAVSLGWDLATLNRRHFAGIRGLRLTQHGA